MKNIEIIKILKSMGYREIKKGVWGKPIGHCILVATFHSDNWLLRGFFMGKDGKIYNWQTKNFNRIEELKSAETECYHELHISSNFEFSTRAEYLEDFL